MREILEMHETFETKNIKRFRRFKPQAFQASSFKADPDFRQDDSYGDDSVRQRAKNVKCKKLVTRNK